MGTALSVISLGCKSAKVMACVNGEVVFFTWHDVKHQKGQVGEFWITLTDFNVQNLDFDGFPATRMGLELDFGCQEPQPNVSLTQSSDTWKHMQ